VGSFMGGVLPPPFYFTGIRIVFWAGWPRGRVWVDGVFR
jgi:hypothetical protein